MRYKIKLTQKQRDEITHILMPADSEKEIKSIELIKSTDNYFVVTIGEESAWPMMFDFPRVYSHSPVYRNLMNWFLPYLRDYKLETLFEPTNE